MKSIIPEFNTNRMVKDYTEKYYHLAHHNYTGYLEEKLKISKGLSEWKEKIKKIWSDAHVLEMHMEEKASVTVGSLLHVNAKINLGKISPDDVLVELYFGSVDQFGDISDGVAVPMERGACDAEGIFFYTGQMLCLPVREVRATL